MRIQSKVSRKRLGMVALVAASAFSLVLAGCSSATPSPQETHATGLADGGGTVRLGASLCLSGSGAFSGQKMQQGLDLGVERLNEVFKDKNITFQVDYEDNELNAEKAVTIFNKLVGEGDPLFVQCGSSIVVAEVPLAEEDNVVLLNTSASSPRLVGLSDQLFNTYLNSRDEVAAIVQQLKADGRKSVCIDSINTDLGKAGSDLLKQDLEAASITVACADTHDGDATDFKDHLAKIKSAAPDAIVLLSQGTSSVAFVQQMGTPRHRHPAVLVGHDRNRRDLLKLAAVRPKASYTAPYYDLDASDSTTKDYVARYSAKNTDTPHFFTTAYYEGTLVWGAIVQYLIDKDLPYNGDTIKEALNNIAGVPGVGGDTIKFGEGNTAARSMALKTVKDGEFVFVKKLSN